MKQRLRLSTFVFWIAVTILSAQQVPDDAYHPPLPQPAYALNGGPQVAIDQAHHNFHTVSGRYAPFAALLRRDGYRVSGIDRPFSADSLRGVAVLVIANALNARNVRDWSLPTPSAFTAGEIAAVHTWVEQGGSLFLIADPMPFAGAATDLARAFGVQFSNGFAVSAATGKPGIFDFRPGTGLADCSVTEGRSADERVRGVKTFVGSAFRPPGAAIPVLRLGAGHISLLPERAWGFAPDTKRQPLDGWCQGAIMPVGKGRVAVFGEAAMFSAQLAGPERRKMGMNSPWAKQNHQLLLTVMHWLTRAPGMPD